MFIESSIEAKSETFEMVHLDVVREQIRKKESGWVHVTPRAACSVGN